MAENTSIRARAEISKRCKKEARKMTRFYRENGVDAEKIDALTPLFDNICWMQIKLDDARAEIGEDGLLTEYDNGGGQSGYKKNEAVHMFNKTNAQMLKLLSELGLKANATIGGGDFDDEL